MNPSDTSTSSEEKVLVFENGEKYVYTKEREVYVDGQLQKDSVGAPLSESITRDILKDFYKKFFSQYFENIVILSAAGSSIDNGEKSGKDRLGLWKECESDLASIATKIDGIKGKEFWKNKNLEDALSYIETYNTLGIKDLNETISSIKGKIRNNCNLPLSSIAPHRAFLSKLTSRKANSNRIQLFTTNYDTLFEQAASEDGIVVIDGFSFAHPRKFSGRNFDIDIVNREKTRMKNEDNFIPNVIHIYKLHGSLDWKRDGNDIVQVSEKISDDALIIYPASDKFRVSLKTYFGKTA